MCQCAELSRDLSVILNAGLPLGHRILISLTAPHPAEMEFASQTHTLNTISYCLINPSALMKANRGWGPRHCSVSPGSQSCLQRTEAAGQGDRPTDVTWDPQMLSRMIHTELRMQLC